MMFGGRGMPKSQKNIAILCCLCYSPYYQIKEDKNMTTFIMNSLRRRERRRKLL